MFTLLKQQLFFMMATLMLVALIAVLTQLTHHSTSSSVQLKPAQYSGAFTPKSKVFLSLLAKSPHQAVHFDHVKQRNVRYMLFGVVVLIAVKLFKLASQLSSQCLEQFNNYWLYQCKKVSKHRQKNWKNGNLLYKAKLIFG